MSQEGNAAVLAATRDALDALASGLTRVDLDTLVATSAQVESAAERLRRLNVNALRHAAGARDELDGLRLALARCRRLGASLADAVRLARAAHGTGGALDTYGPQGDSITLAPPTRAFDAQA
jgi:hypothetical protein